MARYLWKVSYTQSGVQGLMKEGAVARRDYITKLVSDLGGRVEAFYWAFGEHDLYGIAEFPDDQTAAGFSMAVAAKGAVSINTTVLLTAEEIDAGIGKAVSYRPPGA
jgi:uncharacterized protein with GYD domain